MQDRVRRWPVKRGLPLAVLVAAATGVQVKPTAATAASPAQLLFSVVFSTEDVVRVQYQ
jgi:hypothetical protein